MTKLKVFRGNYDGCNYRLVATTSKPKAMSLVGQPNKRRFDKYFDVIENMPDCEVALLEPEVVFTKPISFEFGKEEHWEKI